MRLIELVLLLEVYWKSPWPLSERDNTEDEQNLTQDLFLKIKPSRPVLGARLERRLAVDIKSILFIKLDVLRLLCPC